MKISVGDLICDICADVANQKEADVEKIVQEGAEKLVSKLRAIPFGNRKHTGKRKRTPHYSKGWTMKTDFVAGEKTHIVYNRTPQLTHLLEKGTVNRETDRGANKGAGPEIPHIRPMFEEIEQEMKNKIKEL
jgi:hypothetical protein